MKAVRLNELDYIKEFPVAYIVRNDELKEYCGCCPLAFFNFFGLLNQIEGLNSEFLIWLKYELKEDSKTLITPPEGIKSFLKNSLFDKIDYGSGYLYEMELFKIIGSLLDGCVLFTILFKQGLELPSHCVVFYVKDRKLFADGSEISLQTFAKMIYCHEKNIFLLGKEKARD